MKYQEIKPNNSYSNLVKLFWQFENTNSSEKHYTILPDGFFSLVVFIVNSKIDEILLYGIWSKQIDVVVPAFTTVLGVSFNPIAAEYIFNETIADIHNSFKPLSNSYFGINNLPIDNFQEFANQFLNLISKNIKIDARKIKVFELLFLSSSALYISELSKKVLWSSRQMNRYFKYNFGLTLKTYANILRCSAAYLQIKEGNLYAPLAYYDQSHFIKEIRKYTGFNPKVLHKNKNDRFLQFSFMIK